MVPKDEVCGALLWEGLEALSAMDEGVGDVCMMRAEIEMVEGMRVV